MKRLTRDLLTLTSPRPPISKILGAGFLPSTKMWEKGCQAIKTSSTRFIASREKLCDFVGDKTDDRITTGVRMQASICCARKMEVRLSS